MKSHQAMRCNISLKIHFLNSHLDFFSDNLEAVSEKHSERLNQQISTIEDTKASFGMVPDYFRTNKRDVPHGKYLWKSPTLFFNV